MTQDEIWARKCWRAKVLNTAADYLAVDICELLGGAAEIEGTPERLDVFRAVWQMPAYNHEARRRALTDPVN